ncbi:polysaccharide deacetylase family protein [Paenibacillus sp. NPDC057934]|uniref:polysaccharide deacetylase n=1 Tax=Paenibacillus sp. NPDC057934 TaxID=3346282 RepID=UPI0036DF51DD
MSTKKLLLLFIAFFVSLGWVHESEAAGLQALKLGVNDKLTGIEAVSVKDTYYVPLRDLAQELGWTLNGLSDGIGVNARGSSLKLLNDHTTATLNNGSKVPMDTFLRGGKLMVPLRVSALLGYTISYVPEQYLLRVQNSTAKLNDAAFVSKYKKELQPKTGTGSQTPTAPGTTTSDSSGKPGTTVYMTFDDGPSATTTQLLDILAKYKVKATFFMLGPKMNTYPEQVKRTAKEGHGLGLHGMTHRKEKFYASPAAALGEMNNDNAILKKITGTGTSLIRPPYGSKPYFTNAFRDKVLTQGYHLWDWNVDSDDWKYKENSAKIYNIVMGQVHNLKKSQSNPIILMHDQKATLKVLPQILETLKKEGYHFEIITKDMQPHNFWKDYR